VRHRWCSLRHLLCSPQQHLKDQVGYVEIIAFNIFNIRWGGVVSRVRCLVHSANNHMAQELRRPLCTRMHTVSFLVHLTTLPDLKTQVMFIIESLPRHDGFGAESIRNSPLWWEEVEEFKSMEDDVNRQELGNSFVWEAVAGGSTPFLHHSDAAFNLWDILLARWPHAQLGISQRLNAASEW
jgi:hypothetical protein